MPSTKAFKKKKPGELSFRRDGWERFEQAVDSAVKSGPIHKPDTASEDVPTRKRPEKIA